MYYSLIVNDFDFEKANKHHHCNMHNKFVFSDSVHIIDYEFATFNYEHFEIGNLFCEYAGLFVCITNLFGWLVCWLVGLLVGRLVGWSVGRSVGRSVGWLVGWLVVGLDCFINDLGNITYKEG